MRTIARISACMILASVCAGCMQKHLLLVTQYPEGTQHVSEAVDVIRREFKAENVIVRLDVFNMDTLSHPTPMWRDGRGDMAVVRVNALRPEIVFVAGDDAARYFAQRLVNTPKRSVTSRRLIFLGIKGDPSSYGFSGATNVTGVREETPVRETFELMKKLAPSAATVGVLADTSLEGDAVVARIREASDLPLRVTTVKRAGTLAEWTTALKELQNAADVLCIASYGSVVEDPKVRDAIPAADLLSMTTAMNRLPDCAFRKEAVGPKGVLAAVSVPVAAQARLAARMAIRILYYSGKIERTPIATPTDRATSVSPERAAQLGIVLPAEFQPASPSEGGGQ